MTIERRRLLWAGAAALAAWFAGVTAVTVLAEPTGTVFVLGPEEAMLRTALLAGTAPRDAGRGFVRTGGETPGFVRELYRQGAWLVWPAPAGGCRRPVGKEKL